MSDVAKMAEPISDVRDVVETYRRYGIEIENWRDVLSEALASIERASVEQAVASTWVKQLANHLQEVVRVGLVKDDTRLDVLAEEVERILTTERIPGMPRPEDTSWEF